MNQIDIISATKSYVAETLAADCTGHDWWHIYRVWKTAQHIVSQEGGDSLIVELAALLHDIADWKFHDGDLDAGPRQARLWLTKFDLPTATIDAICTIVKNVSFKGANVAAEPLSKEGEIVQDADRLDALGAIGIARTFAYGGAKKRAIYDPAQSPQTHDSFQAYQRNEGTTINHFYEKLLLLKDRMNTQTGLALAEKRHQFLTNFLEQFYHEWDADYDQY